MRRWKHEESIRNKLADYQPNVDTDKLWESVKDEVPRKKRRAAWLILFGILGAAAVTGAVYNLTDVEKTDIVSINVDSSNSSSTAISSTTAHTKPSVQSEEVNTKPSLSQSPSVNISENQIPPITESTKPEVNIDGVLSSTVDISAESQIQTDIESTSGQATRDAISEAPSETPSISPVNRTLWSPLNRLSTSSLTPLLETRHSSHVPILPAPDMIKVKPKNHIGLLVYSGIGASWTNLKFVDEPDFGNSLEESIQMMPTIEAGAAAVIPLGNKWRLQTGIRYSRYTSKLDWTTNTIEDSFQPGVQSITINPDGSTTLTNGTVRNRIIESTTGTYYSYLHSLGLEVQVGYQVWSARQLRLFVHGGGVVQATLTSSGSMPNLEGEITPWDKSSSPYAGISLGAVGGCSLEYYISPKAAIVLTPTMSYSTIAFDNSEFTFNQSITALGGRLGVLIML